MEIISLKINANSNATETLLKVKNCFSFLIPLFDSKKLVVKSVLGGYGNPIITLEYNSINKTHNIEILTHIANYLSAQDKRQIHDELESRTNSKGILHLRFNKRSMAQNLIRISTQSDSFRIAVKISHNNQRFNIKKNFRELNEFLCDIGIIVS